MGFTVFFNGKMTKHGTSFTKLLYHTTAMSIIKNEFHGKVLKNMAL